MASNAAVVVRPVAEHDEDGLRTFFSERLSERSRWLRFHSPAQPPLSYLASLARSDRRSRGAIVAEDSTGIVAVGEWIADRLTPGTVHLAVAVADEWQHRGIGRRLMRQVVREAAEAGGEEARLDVLSENRAAVALARPLLGCERMRLDGPTASATVRLRRRSA